MNILYVLFHFFARLFYSFCFALLYAYVTKIYELNLFQLVFLFTLITSYLVEYLTFTKYDLLDTKFMRKFIINFIMFSPVVLTYSLLEIISRYGAVTYDPEENVRKMILWIGIYVACSGTFIAGINLRRKLYYKK